MIPVDYELGRQYQLERQREAATHRLARRAAVARHIRAAHHLSLPTARQLRAWIDRLQDLSQAKASRSSTAAPS